MMKWMKLGVTLAAVTLLAACAGGGGGTTPNEQSPGATEINGKVADGYLRGAIVFADMNGNKRLDNPTTKLSYCYNSACSGLEEPFTVSGPGGEYQLGAAARNYPIVVLVNKGVFDEGRNKTVEKPFVLSAPIGKPDFVSPMTTLVQSKIEKKLAASPEQAAGLLIAELKKTAKVPSVFNSVDLFANFEDKKLDADVDVAKSYNSIALASQVVASAVAKAQEDIQVQMNTLAVAPVGAQDALLSGILAKALETVGDQLGDLYKNADNVIYNGADLAAFDSDGIASRDISVSLGSKEEVYNSIIANVDSDGDGLTNAEEKAMYNAALLDTDGDGHLDDANKDGIVNFDDDRFPYDPSEWADTDGDGYGDNVDRFINDEFEWSDIDGDGEGDNADIDDDNDGLSDAWEALYGTNPLYAGDKLWDMDKDGLTNLQEYTLKTYPNKLDTDNDGYNDKVDVFPLDVAEWVDTDGDGTGNNADTDDDEDTWSDTDEGTCGTDPLLIGDVPTDTDLDGLCDDFMDNDNDGDTYLNDNDAFPLDASEWLDTDGDDVGNNTDTDDDNDTWSDVDEGTCGTDSLLIGDVPTDTDGDHLCDDAMDTDNDNDGVLNGSDDFPLDVSESVDTDGDLIGNNADLDDDNDNWLDVDELACGTDSLSNVSVPADNDSDNVCDVVDTDDDNDGTPDLLDAFPFDSAETIDTDGDQIGDNADNCISVSNNDQANSDADMFGDVCDAFPNDTAEWLDTDLDQVGDNSDNCPADYNPGQENADGDLYGDVCDTDTDNDGVLDADDAFPNDATQTTDTDGDGFGDDPNGNNPDAFIDDPAASLDADGDGYPDEWNTGKTEVDSTTGLLLDGALGDINAAGDHDGDGVDTLVDNCPLVPNADQLDVNPADGIGDACASAETISFYADFNQALADLDAAMYPEQRSDTWEYWDGQQYNTVTTYYNETVVDNAYMYDASIGFENADAVYAGANLATAGSDVQAARFFRAVSRVVAVIVNTQTDGVPADKNAISDLWDLFGIPQDIATRGNYELIFNSLEVCSEDQYGYVNCNPNLASTSPTTGEIVDFMNDVLVTELNGAIADLQELTSIPGFTYAWTDPVDGYPVEIDRADAYFMRGVANLLAGYLRFADVYNLDVNLYQMLMVENMDTASPQWFLETFVPNLGKFDASFTQAARLAQLAEAKQYFLAGLGDMDNAVLEIETETFGDDSGENGGQDDDLISMVEYDEIWNCDEQGMNCTYGGEYYNSVATAELIDEVQSIIAQATEGINSNDTVEIMVDEGEYEVEGDETYVYLDPSVLFNPGIEIRTQVLPGFAGEIPLFFPVANGETQPTFGGFLPSAPYYNGLLVADGNPDLNEDANADGIADIFGGIRRFTEELTGHTYDLRASAMDACGYWYHTTRASLTLYNSAEGKGFELTVLDVEPDDLNQDGCYWDESQYEYPNAEQTGTGTWSIDTTTDAYDMTLTFTDGSGNSPITMVLQWGEEYDDWNGDTWIELDLGWWQNDVQINELHGNSIIPITSLSEIIQVGMNTEINTYDGQYLRMSIYDTPASGNYVQNINGLWGIGGFNPWEEYTPNQRGWQIDPAGDVVLPAGGSTYSLNENLHVRNFLDPTSGGPIDIRLEFIEGYKSRYEGIRLNATWYESWPDFSVSQQTSWFDVNTYYPY